MKPKLLLRIASAVMLLHAVGHTFGALTWNKAPNEAVADVIRGMVANSFEFMGRRVTLASFYSGYGIALIFVLLLITVLLWLFGGNTADRMTRQALPFVIVFLGCFSVTEWIYFFPTASIMSMVAAVLALLGYVRLRRLPVA